MNILLTSVGRRSYLVEYFKKAIGNKGKIHAANSEYTIAMQLADLSFITPLIYDKNYIPSILEYCRENDIKAVISLFDIDLLILAKHRELFEKYGIKIILAPEKSVRICNDKWATYQFLNENDIRTPKTYLTIGNAMTAIDSGYTSFPLVIKPRWGMASMGLYSVENEEELHVLYKRSLRDIFKTYLKYESQQTPDFPIIIQEELSGEEYGLDVLNDLNANYVKTFAKKKITMRAGETDIGETVSSIIFEDIAKLLSKKINHEALLSVDCFVNDEGLYVVEMNCRISGHYPLSHLAGVNLPKQIIKWLYNETTDEKLLQFKEGLIITKDLVPKIIQTKLT